jgi:hypothetical protein
VHDLDHRPVTALHAAVEEALVVGGGRLTGEVHATFSVRAGHRLVDGGEYGVAEPGGGGAVGRGAIGSSAGQTRWAVQGSNL